MCNSVSVVSVMYATSIALFIVCFLSHSARSDPRNVPMAITTWTFKNATLRAWDVLSNNGSALDAIEQGVAVCECEQCDGTVGYGGSPDEDGETTLDALIMNGKTMNVGAVGGLRRIKNAISVARHVLEHTKHSFLVGDQATEFAVQMGYHEESLTTPDSKKMWMDWHNAKNCQPNFWFNVLPDPLKSCGPYSLSPRCNAPKCSSTPCMDEGSTSTCATPAKVPVPPPCPSKKPFPCRARRLARRPAAPRPAPRAPYDAPALPIDRFNHDTIGMIAIDRKGNMAAGTSTNGVKFKIPGRIGDSPIPGSGAYVDNEVGGATATGDGDIMLRFLPSYVAVEAMRRGSHPSTAAAAAVARVAERYPQFRGAVLAVNKCGQFGAACHGFKSFPYTVVNSVKKELENNFTAVEEMRRGAHPVDAARLAVYRIVRRYPGFRGAVVAADRCGHVGAACNRLGTFHFLVGSHNDEADFPVSERWVKC